MINTAKYLISAPDIAHCPADALPEIAFIGRSNVGKSSLINCICNQKQLAKISHTPGKTKLINYFLVNDRFYLVDLPGYGYAKSAQKTRRAWHNNTLEYFKKRTQIKNIFVLIDASIPPQKTDVDFICWLGKNTLPFSIIFTKTDKEKQTIILKNTNDFLAVLMDFFDTPPYFLHTSSKKKTGKAALLTHMQSLL